MTILKAKSQMKRRMRTSTIARRRDAGDENNFDVYDGVDDGLDAGGYDDVGGGGNFKMFQLSLIPQNIK